MNYANLVFSLIAFALSVLAFFCRTGIQSTESGALALIAICATLIVGVSVVDSMRLKELENQIKELTDTKRELDKLKDDFNKLRIRANISLDANWGFTLYEFQPKNAIVTAWKAIILSFSLNESNRIKTCISVIKTIIDKIGNSTDLSNKLKKECKNRMPIEITNEIRNSDEYIGFKDKLDELIEKITDIINNKQIK